jgi:hypothetical protein
MNIPLTTACILKESLRQVWEGETLEEGTACLEGWISQARASGVRTLAALAAESERHSEGILGWYRHRITAAPPEGLDTRIKALIRRACCFRNMGNLKRMILAIGGVSPQRLFAPGWPVRPAFGILINPGHSAEGDGAGTFALDWSHAGTSSRPFQCMCALFHEHGAPLR